MTVWLHIRRHFGGFFACPTAQAVGNAHKEVHRLTQRHFRPAIHGHHAATRLEHALQTLVHADLFFNRHVVDGVKRDDAIKGVVLERKVGDIGIDVDALLAQALASFLQGDHRKIHTDPVAIVLGVGQVFVILDRT